MISILRLQQFRSYKDISFEFSPEVTIVAGPNASGKTNLLEAVLVVAKGASYRAKDAELVAHGESWARLDAETSQGKRTIKLKPAQKTFEFDDKPYQRLLRQHVLPVVLFEPNHMLLLSGSPDLRRQFMDDLLEQTVPRYGEYRRHYKRVLSQRNALLKKRLTNQLFVWDIRLSELGGKIAKERARLVDELNDKASSLYSEISGIKTAIALQYSLRFPHDTYESSMLRALEHDVEKDIVRGFTSNGPHREDMTATIEGKLFQESASRGENRTLVLALKLIELQLLEQDNNKKPMLLLDDVFSELDASRREHLTKALRKYQTIITTTDADIVTPHLPAGKIIKTTEVI